MPELSLRDAMPLDYSFKKIDALTELKNSKPREGRVGKSPYRGMSGKFFTKALWLNNNELTSISGIDSFITRYFEFPQTLSWIDFSFNGIKEIDKEITKFPNLIILYIHGNCIENMETVAKLRKLPKLKRLTLHGNPISEVYGYRSTVIFLVPQILNLDFSPVINKERFSPAPPGIGKKYESVLS